MSRIVAQSDIFLITTNMGTVVYFASLPQTVSSGCESLLTHQICCWHSSTIQEEPQRRDPYVC